MTKHGVEKIWLGLAVLLACSASWAETDPYTFSVAEALTHDSNVQRAQAGQVRGDTYSSTDFRAAVDQPFGRQRLMADADIQVNRYVNEGRLNNVAPQLHAELDWSAAERWQGEFGGNFSRQLIRYDLYASQPVTGRNIQTASDGFFRARVGVVTQWTLEGALLANRRIYSQALYDPEEMTRRAAELGLRYQPNPDLQARLLFRRAVGSYPLYSPTLGADRFDRNDVEAQTSLRFSGATLVDLRLTRGDESHSQQTTRSARLWSGSAGLQWAPTGKLQFNLRWTRDSDVGAQELQPGQNAGDTKISRRTDASVTWRATEKIQVLLVYQQTSRDLDRAGGLGAAPETGRDLTRVGSLGLQYSPTRSIETGCSVSQERRTTTGDTALSYPFRATVGTCFGKLSWR